MAGFRLLLILMLFVVFEMKAQDTGDTTRTLQEVVVKAYFSEQPMLKLPVSVSVLTANNLTAQSQVSPVSAMNSVPGVRMEERSPGSYRLSLRGSLLRSPFGIRNVKIYIDEFPFTDPGGNTYLNLFDISSINRIEILKGPEASVFGANSGGVILINPNMATSAGSSVSASVNTGSYGLFSENVSFQKQLKSSYFDLSQSYQTANGYRENSDLRRNFGMANYRWNYSKSSQIRATGFYSNLQYQTPGGLTALQMEADPRSARPATPTLPGAVAQKAGVKNETFYGAVLNETRLSPKWRHVAAVFASHTDFSNSAITNYEVKDEGNFGLRTYLDFRTPIESRYNFNWQIGAEAAHGSSDVSVFDNNGGQKGGQRSFNRLNSNYSFFFSHLSVDVDKWFFEAAASLNFNNYKFRSLLDPNSTFRVKKFEEQIMPRVALSYRVIENLALRASVSKGYSPPTIDEVTGSNNVINPDLQPEKGWNFEAGVRYRSLSDRIYLDASVFRYDLKEAIVRRLDESDVEYFVNAGGTKQTGVEAQVNAWLIKPAKFGFLRSLQLNTGYTYSNFIFTDYLNGQTDFSGNRLTGVPKHILVNDLNMRFPLNLYLFFRHNYTSAIPLHDNNSVFAGSYNLFQLRGGWRSAGKRNLDLYFGIDNLSNERYSLGNDINAAGGRFYNPSAGRNYYLGIKALIR